MRERRSITAAAALVLAVVLPATARADTEAEDAVVDCAARWRVLAPSAEPLAACQWDMVQIRVAGAHAVATGVGVRLGIIDTGVDVTHADILPNLDLAASCSFLGARTPTADPTEIGDCSDKGAVQDANGRGTHLASIAAAPVNGTGIGGVAPDARIVALKACTAAGHCFAGAVARALRHAAAERLDVVQLGATSLYACGDTASRRAAGRDVLSAADEARHYGVVIVTAAYDASAAAPRLGRCRAVPVAIGGGLAVAATGPRASATAAEATPADIGAPGGGRRTAGVLGAQPNLLDIGADEVLDQGQRYAYRTGAAQAAAHVAGVVALVIEQNPNWSSGAVVEAISVSAVDASCSESARRLVIRTCFAARHHPALGAGLVDARAAVLAGQVKVLRSR